MRPRTLKSAAEAGDLDAVKYHLSRGKKINATTAAGHFPLGGAIIYGHIKVVKFLIAHGANVNLKSAYGWTPLYLAAWTGNDEIAAVLIDAHARVNTKTLQGWNSPNGFSPLHVASECGSLDVVKLLIAAGARVGAKDGDGKTAMEIATERGHMEVVEFLLPLAPNSEFRKQFDRVLDLLKFVGERESVRDWSDAIAVPTINLLELLREEFVNDRNGIPIRAHLIHLQLANIGTEDRANYMVEIVGTRSYSGGRLFIDHFGSIRLGSIFARAGGMADIVVSLRRMDGRTFRKSEKRELVESILADIKLHPEGLSGRTCVVFRDHRTEVFIRIVVPEFSDGEAKEAEVVWYGSTGNRIKGPMH